MVGQKGVVIMIRSEINRRQFSNKGQSWFSYHWACWAGNHRGWQKMKLRNKRLFKRKFRNEMRREIEDTLKEIDNHKEV